MRCEKILYHLSQVEEAQLMFDRNTLRHRGMRNTLSAALFQTLYSGFAAGFGFVTFEKPQPAEKVCSIQYHDIKGKKVSHVTHPL